MAAGRQATSYRRANNISSQRQAYVYGNTVRQPEVLPKRMPKKRQQIPQRTSVQVRRNRKKAMSMNPAYAVFLVVAAVCAVLICVTYLKLQSDIVNRSESITALREELAELTESNDTAYNAAADSVNLQTIRGKAMSEMGMVYAAQGNVVEYDSPTSDYVKQYSDIPSDGVLAKSKNTSD